jgi:hypothetical protein
MSADRSWSTSGIDEEALATLAERLPASEVWTLLLEVVDRRAARRAPKDLRAQWAHDRFTQPAAIDPRRMLAIDAVLFEAATQFEAIELSPLAPLGVCSRMAPTSQRRVVSALRGTEVVADPTNVLALECARRLKDEPGHVVRLAASHRAVRAQPAPKGPGYAQHFRLFCLVTAGRERVDHGFVVEHLVEHIQTHVSALDRLEQNGYSFTDRTLRLLASSERAGAADRVAAAFAGVSIVRDTLEHPYYDGLRFTITTRPPDGGEPQQLIDGGAFNWLGTLTSNHRLAFVASGMGSQMVAVRYFRS